MVPKESSWFGSEAVPEDKDIVGSAEQQPLAAADKEIIPMRLQPLYTEDWIGLKQIDERGDVVFESCEGEHMQLGECWEGLVRDFVGGR